MGCRYGARGQKVHEPEVATIGWSRRPRRVQEKLQFFSAPTSNFIRLKSECTRFSFLGLTSRVTCPVETGALHGGDQLGPTGGWPYCINPTSPRPFQNKETPRLRTFVPRAFLHPSASDARLMGLLLVLGWLCSQLTAS